MGILLIKSTADINTPNKKYTKKRDSVEIY